MPPFKYNQTKFNKFSDSIRKISKKKTLSESEKRMMVMATIISAFSSTHSWKTSKSLLGNACVEICNNDLHQEFKEAESKKWKNICVNDIREIASKNISDNTFYRWVTSYVDAKQQDKYREAWDVLKNEIFEKNCD